MTIMTLLPTALAVAYVVRVLLYDAHATGPFEASKHVVIDSQDPADCRCANLFDRVRRLFGAYLVAPGPDLTYVWYPYDPRMQVWRCPKCLSFWVAFMGSIPTMVLSDISVWWFPIVHLAISFLASLFVFVLLVLEGVDDGLR